MEVFHTLVKKVARAYYKPKFIVVLDLLSTNGVTSLKEEDIASKVKLSTKEIQKICGKLKDYRLIKSEQKSEERKDGRNVTKQYYYIDYKLFVDTVKWKIHQMTKKINEKRENELQNKGYRCPACDTKYSPLDVLTLIDQHTNLFMCEYCRVELIQENNEESENAVQELYSKLMLQCGPILDLLKMTDKLVIPDYTPSASGNTTVTEKTNLPNQRGGIRISEDTEDITGEIVIEFQNSDDELLRKKQEEENKLKRKQNELPAWYQFSTVTGERVAPGPEENEPDKEDEEIEKKKDIILIDEDLDDSYLSDFYDQLKMSSNDNIKLILTTENEYQDSDDSSTDVEEFVEVDFKKNNEESNKRTIDSTDEIGSDMENENGRRKKVKVEQINTPTSMNEDETSSDYRDNDDNDNDNDDDNDDDNDNNGDDNDYDESD